MKKSKKSLFPDETGVYRVGGKSPKAQDKPVMETVSPVSDEVDLEETIVNWFTENLWLVEGLQELNMLQGKIAEAESREPVVKPAPKVEDNAVHGVTRGGIAFSDVHIESKARPMPDDTEIRILKHQCEAIMKGLRERMSPGTLARLGWHQIGEGFWASPPGTIETIQSHCVTGTCEATGMPLVGFTMFEGASTDDRFRIMEAMDEHYSRSPSDVLLRCAEVWLNHPDRDRIPWSV